MEGALASGFPVRISFRAALGGAQTLLLCLEEGSIVQRAEGKWLQVEAELTSVLDSMQTGTILLDAAGEFVSATRGSGSISGWNAGSCNLWRRSRT